MLKRFQNKEKNRLILEGQIILKKNGDKTELGDWTKSKGLGIVQDRDGNEVKAELHWYECKGLEKFDFKVKKWEDK